MGNGQTASEFVDESFFWEHLDWSFIVVLVAVVVLATLLIRWYRKSQRRQRRSAKRARRTAYKEWLQASGVEGVKRQQRGDKDR